jgi:hypothetical protein
VILYDEKNGNPEILDFLLPYNIKPNVQTWRGLDFDNNFAEWKNKLNEYCEGDYIFQLDADEMISKYMVQNINVIVGMNPDVDLYYLPRINTVEGLTQKHVDKWGWRVTKFENQINEKIIDTESEEYNFLSDNGLIIVETII